MKFETNLTQDPVSTRKKETFVQSYILLYSIFFEKNWELLLPCGKICGFHTKLLPFYSKFSFAIQASKSTWEVPLGKIAHIRRQLHKIV